MHALPQPQLRKILALPVRERLRLVEAIWESLDREPEAPPLTASQRRLLDQRLDAFLANPNDLLTWDEVKAGLDQRSP